MSKHYTLLTLEDTVFCKTCNAKTRHKVSARTLGHCIPCFEKRQEKEAQRKSLEAAQPVFAFTEGVRC
jgi:hypothetical protein